MSLSFSLRYRRKSRQRYRIKSVGSKFRLCVHRTNNHIYAQIIDDEVGSTLLAVSTLSRQIKGSITSGGNKEAASLVGREIAKEALGNGIKSVVFDRSGFLYHGRVRSLADAARESGLSF